MSWGGGPEHAVEHLVESDCATAHRAVTEMSLWFMHFLLV